MCTYDKHRCETLSCVLCIIFILLIIVVAIFAFFFVFVYIPDLLLHPPIPSPEFTLLGLKLYAFNFSTTNSTLTTTLQIDISCRNSNNDHAFHFDKLEVYASYMKQRITLPTTIPPSYLGSPKFTIWSPYLNGTDVPLSRDLAMALAEDETAGTVLVNVEVTGRLRLRHLFTFRNRLKVNCPRYLMLGNKKNGSDEVGSAVKNPFVDGCPVDVSKRR
ncbi:hypothetical protein SSX86_021707 [Deinandra increscens subsp. villosa]|uniref:Late embryogenesis abundant protein LEA-2 subgroup domain-containing protein n=1 Tax=Deinandra increscens subsp. villosa TaxID=3103831 RepID=A0AAP0CR81_9ASTR